MAEESSFNDVVQKLKLTGNDSSWLFMLDSELAKRVLVRQTKGKSTNYYFIGDLLMSDQPNKFNDALKMAITFEKEGRDYYLSA